MNAKQFLLISAFSIPFCASQSLAQVTDSLRVAVPDSILVVPGPDSVLVVPPPDSLLVAAPDSIAADPAEEWFAPWQPAPPVVDRATLDWTRPEDFDRALDWLEGTSVRVAGETGMDAFVDTGPLGRPAEILVDGLPSRSPADLDPAIWDRASTMVVALASSRTRPAYAWGGSSIDATMDDPLSGRTVLHTYFTRARHETYTRAVGLRTPGTKRMLRFDFQEFKTEEGYDYSLAPRVIGDSVNRGRSKQRRFRLGGKAKTTVGEIGFEYGRGRRYTRGDVMSAAAHERWTARLALTFDREDQEGAWRARMYHLDFRDDWFDDGGVSWQSSDATRLGLAVERQVPDAGFFGGFGLEHQSARFLPRTLAAADTTYHDTVTGQVGAGWRAPADADWRPWVSVLAVVADHTRSTADVGGRAGIRRRLGGVGVQVMAERIPQTPTLAETYGVYTRRLVTPTAGGWNYDDTNSDWTFSPGGRMEFERQDRAEIRLDDRDGRLQWSLAYSLWSLSRGIGWEPVGTGTAQVVSGVETDLGMLEASLMVVRNLGRVRMRLMARGHWLPGSLESAAGRPGGFPREAVFARLGLDREFFSPRNRIGIDVETEFMGEHFDDLTAPLGGVVPSSSTLDSRAWLMIRNAELYFAVDNMLDAERMEVLGTWRRFRQFRFGLTWNFFN